MTTTQKIEQKLTQELSPTRIKIVDNSQSHAGHTGNQSGGGHFSLLISSPAFEGKSMIECHRMIYAALGDMMQNEIHALSINIE